MCGIIAVVPRPSGRTAPAVDLLARLEDALSNALEAEAGDPASRLDALRRSASSWRRSMRNFEVPSACDGCSMTSIAWSAGPPGR